MRHRIFPVRAPETGARNLGFTGVAQLVEYRSPKPMVGGSSPSSRAFCNKSVDLSAWANPRS